MVSAKKQVRGRNLAVRTVTFLTVSLQKKNAENINSRLALVMKSGKVSLGHKNTLKSLRNGKGKMHRECDMTTPIYAPNMNGNKGC